MPILQKKVANIQDLKERKLLRVDVEGKPIVVWGC
jgi:hypothetical protein